MSAASTETSAPLPSAGSRVFFQAAPGVGCVSSGPITADDPVQKRQGKVTVKYDRKELRKRLVLEEWIIEQLSDLYDCEVSGGEVLYPTDGLCALRHLQSHMETGGQRDRPGILHRFRGIATQ